MFITLEGIEGSGKSTLLEALAVHLRAAGRSVTTAREPGGTPAGDAIRAVFLQTDVQFSPLTETLLVNASRASLVDEVLRPALARGDTVVCDRYIGSTLAYQGYGRGLDLHVVRAICETASGGLQPDVTLLVDVPLAISRERAAKRALTDRMERQPTDFYARVRDGYLALAAADARWCVLDGTRPENELLGAAMAAITKVLPA